MMEMMLKMWIGFFVSSEYLNLKIFENFREKKKQVFLTKFLACDTIISKNSNFILKTYKLSILSELRTNWLIVRCEISQSKTVKKTLENDISKI